MIRPKLRENDTSLIDIVIKMSFTEPGLDKINAVREHINIQYLGKISKFNRTTIAKGILFGNLGDNWYQRRTLDRNRQN